MKVNILSKLRNCAFIFVLVLMQGALFSQNKGEVENGTDRFGQLALSEPDYLVTSGDVYKLVFNANGSAVNYSIVVDTSYKIRIAHLAVLDARGKTYPALKKQVEEIITKNYPMSGVQFVLVQPSSFYVTLQGEVQSTTKVEAWGLSRLSDVLGNGLTNYSSIRNIQITSADGKKATYDLFLAERFADFSQNPYVRPGDVITIGRIDRKVTIGGEVERPGVYELLPGENLKKLIDYYANGPTVRADFSRLELTSIINENGSENKERISYLTKTDYDADYKLKLFDAVRVPSINELKASAFIEGAILVDVDKELEASNITEVKIEHDLNYRTFINRNRGLFTASSDLENAYIIRAGQTIPINIFKILYDGQATDLVVQPDDVLRIPFKQFFVTVTGAVAVPGRYPYIPDRTYEYYVSLAGGFLKTQNTGKSVEITDVNGKKLSKASVITPETRIEAKTNSFSYYFNLYAPFATTILSILSSVLTVMAYMGSLGK